MQAGTTTAPMDQPAVRGWCPGAWRPMMAGDGLLVRIRPPLGRLSRRQWLGLCEAAVSHGSGAIDATGRANLQIRGVTEQGWPALLDRLVELDLVAPDPAIEERPDIIVDPFWEDGGDSHRIALALAARMGDFPPLPAKTAIVVDAGRSARLMAVPGDLRVERGVGGDLLLRADGRETGVAIGHGEAVDALIALAHWFVASGGTAAGRMRRHRAPLPAWATGDVPPSPHAVPPAPGRLPSATMLGLPFGRIDARTLGASIDRSAATAVRVTPWRMLIVEDAGEFSADDVVIDPASPLLRVDACVGAPACPQATIATRGIAARLAPTIAGHLHVSGCVKGCARATAADVVLVGRRGRFDLVLHGRAGDPPVANGLDEAGILAQIACR